MGLAVCLAPQEAQLEQRGVASVSGEIPVRLGTPWLLQLCGQSSPGSHPPQWPAVSSAGHGDPATPPGWPDCNFLGEPGKQRREARIAQARVRDLQAASGVLARCCCVSRKGGPNRAKGELQMRTRCSPFVAPARLHILTPKRTGTADGKGHGKPLGEEPLWTSVGHGAPWVPLMARSGTLVSWGAAPDSGPDIRPHSCSDSCS